MTFVTDPKLKAKAPDPIAVAVHLRTKAPTDTVGHFTKTDPKLDLTRIPIVGKLLKKRWLQFVLIVPNQIVFWLVIFTGLLGTVNPGLNFATAITWYIWFCVVFVLMVVVGRAWCSMCPFGGFGEWIQRKTFFKRTQKALGLGLKYPDRLAQLGLISSVATFVLLTYIEEFFNIAGPGTPSDTSWMVVGIVSSALLFFLVFERRTFCRYVCPLSTLIGTVGSMGSVAGFRTRDREVCLSCSTKDCMRGGERGYGCPWYTWPGSADSNLYCGLCSECYKGCPEGNVGLFVQKPLTSVIAPRRRRIDVAWGIVTLWGLVLYQQLNATNVFATADTWLNRHAHFPHYPNPLDYAGLIFVGAVLTAGVAWLIARLFASQSTSFDRPGAFLDRGSRFRAFFAPIAYGMIPVVGADYFARQLPKFLQYSPRVLPAVAHIGGLASTRSPLYSFSLMTNGWIVFTQVAVIAVGTLAAAWSTWKITQRELVPVGRHVAGLRATTLTFVLACGAAAAVLYVLMHAAD